MISKQIELNLVRKYREGKLRRALQIKPNWIQKSIGKALVLFYYTSSSPLVAGLQQFELTANFKAACVKYTAKA